MFEFGRLRETGPASTEGISRDPYVEEWVSECVMAGMGIGIAMDIGCC